MRMTDRRLSDVVRSLRRSRQRRDVFEALISLGSASAAQLAEAARVDRQRISAIMFGELPHYKPAFGLVRLGVAMMEHDAHGVRFRDTPFAAEAAAEMARLDGERRAMRGARVAR